jgi:hypothetical protein
MRFTSYEYSCYGVFQGDYIGCFTVIIFTDIDDSSPFQAKTQPENKLNTRQIIVGEWCQGEINLTVRPIFSPPYAKREKRAEKKRAGKKTNKNRPEEKLVKTVFRAHFVIFRHFSG